MRSAAAQASKAKESMTEKAIYFLCKYSQSLSLPPFSLTQLGNANVVSPQVTRCGKEGKFLFWKLPVASLGCFASFRCGGGRLTRLLGMWLDHSDNNVDKNWDEAIKRKKTTFSPFLFATIDRMY